VRTSQLTRSSLASFGTLRSKKRPSRARPAQVVHRSVTPTAALKLDTARRSAHTGHGGWRWGWERRGARRSRAPP
jgi:hypothetical protein